MKKPRGHTLLSFNVRHDSYTPTLKSPLSMMSIILYCWLMSFSSTRFLSAFSWSFLLVSNSRLSDRRAQEDATWGTKRRAPNLLMLQWAQTLIQWSQPTNGGRIQISRLESCLGLWGSGSEQRTAAASARSTVHALLMASRGQQRDDLLKAQGKRRSACHIIRKRKKK